MTTTLPRLLTDTVAVVDRVEDPDLPGTWTETEVGSLPAYVQRATTADLDSEGAVVVRTDYLVLVPLDPDVPVRAESALRWNGALLEVAGDPWTVWNPRTGAPAHVEVRAREVR